MIVHQIDGTHELLRHFYRQRGFNKGKDQPIFSRLEIVALAHNVASQRVAGALGATRECQARNSFRFQGKIESWFAVP